LQCLLEHFSNKGDLIFDPLCGSGMIGVVSYMLYEIRLDEMIDKK